MTDVQKMQILKSKRDAALDLTSLAVFVTILYFAMNPEKYNEVTLRFSKFVGGIEHKLSVWQTKLSIRSLPQTDE